MVHPRPVVKTTERKCAGLETPRDVADIEMLDGAGLLSRRRVAEAEGFDNGLPADAALVEEE